MKALTKICQLCDGNSYLRYEKMQGYVENKSFDIYECERCRASFVDPLRTDQKVYEDIYRQVESVPGYERYDRYAKLVKLVKNPLNLLSDAEGAYWSVVTTLRRLFDKPNEVSVLEIGSGLGYLTYSLVQAGYRATGIDIADDAVRKAKARYGDHYMTKDLFRLAEEEHRYDCVVMMEVIEHVEEPARFVEAALSLLKPGGKLLVTTPNKSAAPKGTIWHSDFPPVHLWFLAEETMSQLAQKLGRTCEFVDFTDYSKKFYSPTYAGSIDDIQRNVPRLDADGNVLPAMMVGHGKTAIFGLRGRFLLSYIRRRLKKKIVSARSTTMCAIVS